ncbi:type II toxin-antitoxin system RelE/ParE family toxin [Scytonema sp. UIC 10036]|uniref:type II toxin-antitoxin system RelE/ParE family toxin n=1 Tax=Scytonema sp. UIC 10036 TaxID=2304196 RepID=UPI0012DA330F|nr:type II toxin-antitoxin system RelE/ParE family toxin [Scytonema sp. UIC 10036]MUG92091.1 type II toxin-antitoxin system RelE/ParE family toxin [Scytonema sp. UIC 10036]
MATYQLTNKAERDIENIYEYSILNFGLRIAQEYVSGMHDCFALLAEYQSWGSNYSFIAPGLQRYEYRSHAIYISARGRRHFKNCYYQITLTEY